MKTFTLSLAIGLSMLTQAATSQNAAPLNLTAEAPMCRTPAVQRPRLKAELGPESKEAISTGWYGYRLADFNGDGWCDVALTIPYPVNSKMESYFLDEMLLLGGSERWVPPFKGKGRPSWFDLDNEIWPRFRIDLTDIVLLYPKSGGAPYVLGLMDGDVDERTTVRPGCKQFARVHRWDDGVGAFKRVDDATRDAVLAFYYASVEKPCEAAGRHDSGAQALKPAIK